MTTKNTKSNKPGPITVEVTATDIKRGETGDAYNCAVARALRRMKFKNVSVGPGEAAFTTGSGKTRLRLVYDLPRRAKLFIDRFDRGVPVKPFTFTLRKLLTCEPALA
jgi:hypothetical protein